MTNATISIDMMGGDHGLPVTMPAAKIALKRFPDVKLLLVGDEAKITFALKKHKLHQHPRVEIQHASEVVEMDEAPSSALRGKKDSSMRVAINMVKDARAEACVSAGNTGALMATARFVLKTLPGIDRPAIIYAIPTMDPETKKLSSCHILDLGANVDCSAENLFQFAVMGSVLTRAVESIPEPRVALLNIGVEEMKGLPVIQETAQMLIDEKAINYTGFVEGNDLFRNRADVVVCDGFIGNIALKTLEGTVKFLGQTLSDAFHKNWLRKLCKLLALPALFDVRNTFDMRQYNGASLVGLKGIVIKSHGGAKIEAFATAIGEAVKEVEKDVPNEISRSVEAVMGARL